MNEFCETCEDRRNEDCKLPSRIKMAGSAVLSAIDEYLEGFTPPGSIRLGSLPDDRIHKELKSPEVVQCIEEHRNAQIVEVE